MSKHEGTKGRALRGIGLEGQRGEGDAGEWFRTVPDTSEQNRTVFQVLIVGGGAGSSSHFQPIPANSSHFLSVWSG